MVAAPGASVVQSIRYLEKIYEDVYSLLSTLDEKLDALGWEPVEKNRISEELGNGLYDGKSWVLGTLWRFYVPRPEQVPGRVIAFELQLDPASSFDVPVLLMMVARMRPPNTGREAWNAWDRADTLLPLVSDRVDPVDVPNDVLQRKNLAPDAEQGIALCVPLFDLNGVEAVQSRLIDPALEMLKRLN